MKRLIMALLRNPLRLFTIIAWNMRLWMHRKRGTRSIVYNLHNDYFFDIFRSIYDELKQDNTIDVWFSWRADRPKLKAYLLDHVGKKLLISNAISPFVNFDLFVTAEVTGPDFPISGMSTKTMEIYHGTGTYNLWEKIAVLNRFDAHLMIGPQYQSFLHAAYATTRRTPRLFPVGYPKLDDMDIPPEEVAQRKRFYGIEDNKPVILYAPHWNPAGSIHAFSESIIIALAAFDAHVLVKVHNYLFVEYRAQMWDERLHGMPSCHYNVHIIDEPDTQRVYPLANVMITDTGTTAALEFSLLSRPLLVYQNPLWFQGKSHYEVEADICKTALLFDTLEQMTALLKNILDGTAADILKQQQAAQKQLIESYLYNPRNATDAAVKAIKELL